MKDVDCGVYRIGTRRAILHYPPDKRTDVLTVECVNPLKELVAVRVANEGTLIFEAREPK